jgi:hypothetical protein
MSLEPSVSLAGGDDASQDVSDRAMTPAELETLFRTRLTAGLSRAKAEELLQLWGIDYVFEPRDQFSRSNTHDLLGIATADSIGALVGSTGVLKRVDSEELSYEVFAIVSVYLGPDGKVTTAGIRFLAAGP